MQLITTVQWVAIFQQGIYCGMQEMIKRVAADYFYADRHLS